MPEKKKKETIFKKTNFKELNAAQFFPTNKRCMKKTSFTQTRTLSFSLSLFKVNKQDKQKVPR